MKTYKKNIIFTVILSIILSFGIQQDSAVAQGMKEVPVYTIWAVDDKGGDLYYYTLNENYDNPDNMTPTLEGQTEGVEGTKDIEAFAIDSNGVMWLINNHKSQTPRESTLYKIDPDQVDGDPNTPVTAVKVGPTGLRAESNNELTNLQFINADGQTDLYGITKRNKKIYKIDIQTGKAGFVATVNTGRTGFRRTDALTQGADGVVYLNETDQDKIYKFESFPGGKLIEVAGINGADKIEALTAHPNGFLYAGDGKSWYKIWPDEPDNNMPTWEKELDFSFGTEGMDFWFETEKVKLDDDDFTDPLADEVILFTNSLGSLDDVANQDGKSLDTRTVIKWFGTGQNVGDSYLGLRFHNFPTYDLKVISAKLQITNNRRNQWIDSSASVYAEKSENPGIFSQDTLPSDRVLTSAYGTYDKDERWNLGQVLSIDVTEPMQELVAEGLAGETVALVVKGTGKRWARLLFNYDNLDVVKLVVVVRDTEPDQTEPEINVKQGATDIPAGTGSYDFGGLTLGSLSTATFTIENTGDEVLTVSSADISSDQFYLDNPDAFPLTVEAGSSATFDIAFDATMTGIHAPTVSIGNDDNDENPYTFILQGVVSANGDELAVYEQGNGLFLYVDGSSRKFLSFLSDWNIEKMIRWGDNRVVDFGSNGLFSHDGISWTFLSSWNADDMISWGDYLVVDFGSDGLFLYDGSELIFMSSWDADNMLSWGDTLVADFGSNGLFYYDDAASGIFVSDWNIDNMIAWGNVLVLDCGSNGVFLYDGSEWTFTSGWDADDMIIWRDQLVVDFGDDGVFIYEQGTSWTFTSSWNPENMITWGDELVMDFGNDGVFIYEEGTSWTFTSSWDAKEMMTWGNELVIDFGDKGVFIYEQGTSWTFTSSWIADNVVTWGDELVVDFGNNGLYVYVDGATWVFISSWDVENMQSW